MIEMKGSHFPRDVILYGAWCYVRFSLSYRDIEELMLERGVLVHGG
jgi:putative transposase